jgi:hypothetical protein
MTTPFYLNFGTRRRSPSPPALFHASPCPCGHDNCRAWHVDPVAAVQGVSFTRVQAEAVATLLNRLAAEPVPIRRGPYVPPPTRRRTFLSWVGEGALWVAAIAGAIVMIVLGIASVWVFWAEYVR